MTGAVGDGKSAVGRMTGAVGGATGAVGDGKGAVGDGKGAVGDGTGAVARVGRYSLAMDSVMFMRAARRAGTSAPTRHNTTDTPTNTTVIGRGE